MYVVIECVGHHRDFQQQSSDIQSCIITVTCTDYQSKCSQRTFLQNHWYVETLDFSMLQFYVDLGSFCCNYAVLTAWLRFRDVLAWNICSGCYKHVWSLFLSPLIGRNDPLNTVLNCGHWLARLAACSSVSMPSTSRCETHESLQKHLYQHLTWAAQIHLSRLLGGRRIPEWADGHTDLTYYHLYD